jgi:hypothetical protein
LAQNGQIISSANSMNMSYIEMLSYLNTKQV